MRNTTLTRSMDSDGGIANGASFRLSRGPMSLQFRAAPPVRKRRKVIVAIFDAVGGPKSTSIGSDGFPQGPTDSGQYVVHRCGRHSSRRYPDWSGIPWGSRLRIRGSRVQAYYNGRWRPVSVTRKMIEEYHRELYGVSKVPTKWVFNDFGHMTCYYFKDVIRNRRLDKKRGERVHGEFIHTTPGDEANTALKKPVILTESHGCVHVKPKDIDDMIKKGYMRKGNLVVVHKYTAKAPTGPVARGRRPYEVHFYPGAKKIVITGYAR